MAKTLNDITAVICNWMTAGMTKGAVISLQKAYPALRIIIVDDGSDEKDMAKYDRAYGRDAYNRAEKLDLNTSKLNGIRGTIFIKFVDHMGHLFTLDRVIPSIKTDLMLTMDSDIRIVGKGLLEEYLEKYNQDPENIYAVGTIRHDSPYVGPNGPKSYEAVDPFFTIWNMEPLHRYPRLGFTNFISPAGNHYCGGVFLCWQLEYDELHRPRKPYHAIRYPEPEQIPQLWHLRKFPDDLPDCERSKKWSELFNG